jgi:hypothetical protein
MASFLDTLLGYKGDHPKDVARAYQALEQQLSRQEGAQEGQQWDEQFKNAQSQGLSPSQAGLDNYEAPGSSPLERWKRQIDGMMKSGNPVLQKQAMSEMTQYRTQAVAAQSKGKDGYAPSTAAKMAGELGFKPGSDAYNNFIKSYAYKSNQNYAPQLVTVPEAKSLEWVDPERRGEKVLPGTPWASIRGQVQTIDELSGMRSQAQDVVSTIEHGLWNEADGIYGDDIWQGEPGIGQVITGGLIGAIRDISQTESGEKYKAYSDFRAGSAAPLIRALGEKGALSDKDVERALALLPNVSALRGLPDLPGTAKRKMSYLRMLLQMPMENSASARNARKALLDEAEAEGLFEPPEKQKNTGNGGAKPPGAM